MGNPKEGYLKERIALLTKCMLAALKAELLRLARVSVVERARVATYTALPLSPTPAHSFGN